MKKSTLELKKTDIKGFFKKSLIEPTNGGLSRSHESGGVGRARSIYHIEHHRRELES